MSKILGDIRKSRCTTGINDTRGKFVTVINPKKKKEHESVTAGTPTSEGTPTSVVKKGTEGMLTTAGPRQQQKSQ
jgi:hypothetical protein